MKKWIHIMILTGCISALWLTGCQSGRVKYDLRDTGIEQLNAGSYSEAVQSFDEALKSSDGLVGTFELDVLKYRAEAEYKAEDFAAAAHTYEVLSQVDEPRPEYIMMQNMLYIKAGELDQAMKAYQAVYGPNAETGDESGRDKNGGDKSGQDEKTGEDGQETAVSDQLTILLPLGQALAEAERPEDAAMLYQQAVDGGVQSAELYNRVGLMELEAGNLDQAMTYFDAGLQMPDDGARKKLLYNQAAVYERKQDFATALELLETFAATYGATPEVEKEITFLKSRQ